MTISFSMYRTDNPYFTDAELKQVRRVLTKAGINPAQIKYRFHCRSDLASNPWQLLAEFDDGRPYPSATMKFCTEFNDLLSKYGGSAHEDVILESCQLYAAQIRDRRANKAAKELKDAEAANGSAA